MTSSDSPSGEPKPKPIRSRSVTLACLLLSAAGLARANGPVPDCDGDRFARVLQPVAGQAPPPADARAYWLSHELIRWPGSDGASHFRLYHSRSGSVRLDGGRVTGADGAFVLSVSTAAPAEILARRFAFIGGGPLLRLQPADQPRVRELAGGQWLLAEEDAMGKVRQATGVQLAGLIDDLYAAAVDAPALGVRIEGGGTSYRLWAPTARQVLLCSYPDAQTGATSALAMQRDESTGIWQRVQQGDASGRYYRYLVEVFVPGVGIVRNRVTDPYSISLSADSARSYIADLGAQALKPEGWDTAKAPELAAQADMVVYELHVRDFSANDASVPAAHRGKYLAFTDTSSNGMHHLQALAQSGLTDVQLLPVFDLATVPERNCTTPAIATPRDGDDEAPQATSVAAAARDCFNWGYDPFHFNAPEGSYATDADDGAVRIREFRAMVQALHAAGLRVGMDVVYNHTTASGQNPRAVLDRIVPGYYHRLDANGRVERSTCCENTATENAMMARLMIDSAELWTRAYHIDSFRFDLMGHQPRAAMEALSKRVDAAAGRHVELIGEGWNYGEVADGKRFVQASQLSLAGSGIGTFSDRARDAIRGGSAGDSGAALLENQGYVNGLVYAPNRPGASTAPGPLLHAADLVRVGLAGTLRDYRMQAADGDVKALSAIAYGKQPAGYASQPAEVVNYVENHDNQTLWDIDAWRLPPATSSSERARVQLLAAALNAFSQGVAYFHAGVDTLRSKSMDRNSFDSGDWFNRLDWSCQDNYFGTGLPPKHDNGKDWERMRALLNDPRLRPAPADIAFMRDGFRDLLRIRASSALFHMHGADEISKRLAFENTGPQQNPVVIAGHLDGGGMEGANFREILYLVNVSPSEQQLSLPAQAGKAWVLHPVQRVASASDGRPRAQARFTAAGAFTVPGRSAVVWVLE
ncbi:MAG: pullulanase-type alpha-1,6-glucosidase [Arenimonas sp.]